MDIQKKFYDYYQAFEEAYDTDEWNQVSSFFTEDATYESPMSGTVTGRDAVMEVFQASLNRFDRRFSKKRKIEVVEEGVVVAENYLKFPGVIHYKTEGAPNLIVEMTEELWYRNGLIEKIKDSIPEVELNKINQHITQYADCLTN